MVRLGIIPLLRLRDHRCDLALLPPLLLGLLRHGLRLLFLLRRVVKDPGAVLRSGVAALPIQGRGVVHFVKEFEERDVGELRGVERYLKGFGVWFGRGGSQCQSGPMLATCMCGVFSGNTHGPSCLYRQLYNLASWCRLQCSPPERLKDLGRRIVFCRGAPHPRSSRRRLCIFGSPLGRLERTLPR